MLASSLFCILGCALLSISLCIVGVIITYFAQGESMAMELMRAWIVEFNGILVGAAGYGLMLFVRRKGKIILAQLNNLLDIPPEHASHILNLHQRATSWFWANVISIPITVVGGIILWKCNFPLQGFARLYLSICTISVYYVASNIFSYFIFTLVLFNYIEEQSQRGVPARLQSRRPSAGMELDAIDSFFIITSTIGVLSIYLGFRGTLTANFKDTPEVFENLLILPILLYLPVTLAYSFYPRYVLRKISECDTLLRIEEFEKESQSLKTSTIKDNLELRKLILEVKEMMVSEHKAPAFLGLKDAPSLTMSILIIIQLALQKDEVITKFIENLFK